MSKGISERQGYQVQVRDTAFNTHHPTRLPDGIIGPEWRDVRFEDDQNPAGVPSIQAPYFSELQLLTYEGAMALGWTILAQNPYRTIEVRLTAHKLISTYQCTEIGTVEMQPLKQSRGYEIKIIPPSQPLGATGIPTEKK